MKSMTGPPRRVLAWSAPVLLALIVLPYVVPPYQTVLLTYGLVFAIAALGFNLLLGYTGLLSFGHSAYFGMGAYAVAFTVKYLKLESMEALLLGGILASGAVAALFGLLCVRYTKIFFGILTMALSQVLWSLAFKFFWVTGGSDGLRVPTPTLLGGFVRAGSDKFESCHTGTTSTSSRSSRSAWPSCGSSCTRPSARRSRRSATTRRAPSSWACRSGTTAGWPS